MGEVRVAANTLGLDVVTLEVRQAEDIERTFEALKGRADALYVCADPLVSANRTRINALALAERLPTMHDLREYAVPGGLLWAKYPRSVPARCTLRRQDFARGEAGRHPGRAADEVRS